jgi:hypothetical protein
MDLLPPTLGFGSACYDMPPRRGMFLCLEYLCIEEYMPLCFFHHLPF